MRSARQAVLMLLACLIGAARAQDSPAQHAPHATRISVLELGDPALPHDDNHQVRLGWQLVTADIKPVIPLLEAEHPDVVVIHQHSGYGEPPDHVDIAQLFHDEFTPRFRTVAWGRSLLGGGGLAVWSLPEVYAHRDASLGIFLWGFRGCTMTGGGMVGKAEMDRADKRIDEIVRLGRHNLLVARAMRRLDPLSADVDAAGRATAWRQDDAGPVVVNPAERILFLKAERAAQLGIITGVADTREELAKTLGFTDVVWLGEPASRALTETAARRNRVLDEIAAHREEMALQREIAVHTPPGPAHDKAAAIATSEFNAVRELYIANPELFRALYRTDVKYIDEGFALGRFDTTYQSPKGAHDPQALSPR